MAKTTVVIDRSNNTVIHDSDGKNSPQAASVGKPIAVVTTPAGKTSSIHGTVTCTPGTHIVFDNPVS